jgi:hypothetical protein
MPDDSRIGAERRCPHCGSKKITTQQHSGNPAIWRAGCDHCGAGGSYSANGEVGAVESFCHPYAWLPFKVWEKIQNIGVSADAMERADEQ